MDNHFFSCFRGFVSVPPEAADGIRTLDKNSHTARVGAVADMQAMIPVQTLLVSLTLNLLPVGGE